MTMIRTSPGAPRSQQILPKPAPDPRLGVQNRQPAPVSLSTPGKVASPTPAVNTPAPKPAADQTSRATATTATVPGSGAKPNPPKAPPRPARVAPRTKIVSAYANRRLANQRRAEARARK